MQKEEESLKHSHIVQSVKNKEKEFEFKKQKQKVNIFLLFHLKILF